MPESRLFSERIKDFTDLIHEVKASYLTEFENVNRCDKATQDVLHELEFGTYKTNRNLATQLAHIRRKRRQAKNLVEVMQPIIEYINKNETALNNLTQLLGMVRKVEKYHQNRVYRKRVNNISYLTQPSPKL